MTRNIGFICCDLVLVSSTDILGTEYGGPKENKQRLKLVPTNQRLFSSEKTLTDKSFMPATRAYQCIRPLTIPLIPSRSLYSRHS